MGYQEEVAKQAAIGSGADFTDQGPGSKLEASDTPPIKTTRVVEGDERTPRGVADMTAAANGKMPSWMFWLIAAAVVGITGGVVAGRR